MRHNQLGAKELLIGAAFGTLLGGISAFLIAPKSGRELREDICDTYCDLSNKTRSLAKKGKSVAQSFVAETNDWAGKIKDAAQGAKKRLRKGWRGEEEVEEENNSARDLLIGTIAGGIVGTAVGLLMAPKPGDEFRQDLMDKCEEMGDRTQDLVKSTHSKANHWLELAKEFLEDLTEDVQDKGEELVERGKSFVKRQHVRDALDWAALGVKLWRGLKSKR